VHRCPLLTAVVEDEVVDPRVVAVVVNELPSRLGLDGPRHGDPQKHSSCWNGPLLCVGWICGAPQAWR